MNLFTAEADANRNLEAALPMLQSLPTQLLLQASLKTGTPVAQSSTRSVLLVFAAAEATIVVPVLISVGQQIGANLPGVLALVHS
jgi:hypothetical protein